MVADDFYRNLLACFDMFSQSLVTEAGDWAIKGFIDVYRNIYTISADTKVVSKIIELVLFPIIARFATRQRYSMILSEHQNHYPDISFVTPDGIKIALDLKTTYRTGENEVNGFTLGTFTGYFRQRHSTKNITFPYEQYAAHFVLGVIYSRSDEAGNGQGVYGLDDLPHILSVIKDFTFLLQEKWRLASDRTGSGNTKNIGSVRNIDALVSGNGTFAPHGRQIFDDYWMNYLTDDMARAIDSEVPYRNIEEYWLWRNRTVPQQS
jgi:hypothetical protein